MLAPLLLGSALAGDAELATAVVRAALVEDAVGDVPAVEPEAPARLRAELDALMRAHPTEDVREAWVRRFPAPTDLDARAERSWRAFGVDAAPVVGLDPVALPATTRLERLSAAAADPWRDHRHQRRVVLGADGQPRLGSDGRPIPDDPAAENVRGLDDDAQDHAFVEYPDKTLVTAEPWAAGAEAWRYAPPRWWPEGPMLSLASTHAQTSVDLALLSALSDDPTVRALGEVHLGQALAYVVSVSMPANTVWFGNRAFEDDATRRYWARGVITIGGLVGPFAPMDHTRGRIAGAYRELALRLTEQHFLAGAGDPQGAKMHQRLLEGDLVMSQLLWKGYSQGGVAPIDGTFGDMAVRFVANDNVMDAVAQLGALHEIADPALQSGEVLDVAPYLAIRDDADPATVTAFWEATERGFRRSGVTLRSLAGLWTRFRAAERTPEQAQAARIAIADRLVRRLDTLRAQADARRAKWEAAPPPPPASATFESGFPIAFVTIPLGLLLIGAVFAFASRTARRVEL